MEKIDKSPSLSENNKPTKETQVENKTVLKSLSSSEETKGSFFNLLGWLVVFLVILFFFFLFFYLAFGRKTIISFKNKRGEDLVTTTPSPIKIGINTKWDIFTSSFNYIIKYPENWQVYRSDWIEEATNKNFYLENDDEAILRFEEKIDTQSGETGGLIIRLKKPLDNSENLPIKDWLKKYIPALSLLKISNLKVAGVDSLRIDFLTESNTTYILIPYQDKVYRIVRQSFLNENLDDYERIFNQILATFEFRNQENSDLETTLEQATTSSLPRESH